VVVNSVFSDSHSTFYVGTNEGILKIEKGKVTLFNPSQFSGYTCIVEVNKDEAVIGNQKGEVYRLLCKSPDTHDIQLETKILLPNKEPFFIKKMMSGRSGFVWMAGNKKQGLAMY